MQAHELATPYPTVRMDSDGISAARLMTEHNRPGLIVVDENDHPIAILPGSQVLRMLVPRYVQDDPTLARVLDEGFADKMCDALSGKTVKDLMPKERSVLPVVAPDDTVLEIAAIMARTRSPMVAVVEERSKTAPLLGAVSASMLLGVVLPPE
ncbi:MAG: CBS domain-containing protein [Nocardioides sp.]